MNTKIYTCEIVAFYAAVYFRSAGYVANATFGGETDTATVHVESHDHASGDTIYEFRGPSAAFAKSDRSLPIVDVYRRFGAVDGFEYPGPRVARIPFDGSDPTRIDYDAVRDAIVNS